MKRNIERRLDELEEGSTEYLSPTERWYREICDDVDDPSTPWEEWYCNVIQ